MKNYASIGSWNIICQVCRAKIKATEAKKRWDGFIVCDDCFELRHPLDMPPPPMPAEMRPLPFTSPDPDPTYITGLCTVASRTAYAGYAVAGCSIAGFTNGGLTSLDGVLAGHFGNGL
jgi:hypothetical protein